MKNDKKIKRKLKEIEKISNYLNCCLNFDASTDRSLEQLIKTVKEIENLYNDQFK